RSVEGCAVGVFAVVHHGGAGTTQAVVRAGRPSVVVAHLVDQFFWGGLLRKQGIALEPLKRNGLTAEKLARHIRRTLAAPSLASRAVELGVLAAAEDGVARAVELIEAHIKGGPR
ncbi:MAG TPA: glycosyltransferase, partial [bacterium]|nr:glycosyltransferase [bacterium]